MDGINFWWQFKLRQIGEELSEVSSGCPVAANNRGEGHEGNLY